MSWDFRIKDGSGESLKARVKKRVDGDNALAIDLGVIDPNKNSNDAYPVQIPNLQDMTNRMRIAGISERLSALWNYNYSPNLFSKVETASGTVSNPTTTGPSYLTFATTGNGDSAEIRTKRYFRYQPFRTHDVSMAVIFKDQTAGVEKNIGQYTDEDGWFVRQDKNNYYFVVRNSSNQVSGTVETIIPKDSWNIDQLDGKGPSGLNLDLSNAITFVITYVWHGTQGIRFGIQYFNKLYWCHDYIWSGTDTKPFAKTAFLPLKAEIIDTGSSAGGDYQLGPMSFSIEEGEKPEAGFTFTASNDITGIAVNSTTVWSYILAIRCKSTINSLSSTSVLLPKEFSILSSDNIYYEILTFSVTSGGTWVDVDSTYSIAEYNRTLTGISTVGKVFKSGYVTGGSTGSGTGLISSVFGSDIYACIDTLLNLNYEVVIRAKKLASNATVWTSISFTESY